MVKRLLNLDRLPGTDAADALGLAITHAQVAWVQSNIGLATQLSSSNTGQIKHGRSR